MHQTVDSTEQKVNGDLAHKALNALKWRFAGSLFNASLRLMVSIVLARILSPKEFGVVGMALIAVGFGRILGDLGFGVAIIQRPYVTQKHKRAAFTGSLTTGLILYIVSWLLAPTISRLFEFGGLTSILRTIGVLFIFSGVSTTSISLLRRALRFQTLAGIEASSYIIGFGVIGVSMAVWGCGVWSLVAANIAQSLCMAVLAAQFAKMPIRPYFGVQEFRELFRIGFAEILNNVTNYVTENLHFFVIGKWLGASALGLYNRCFFLTSIPVNYFSKALLSVMFPVFSVIQGNISRLGEAFLRTVSLSALITTPIFFVIAAAPKAFIGGLFGEEWTAAAGALRILCLGGPFMSIIFIFGAVTHALGYIFSEWKRQFFYLLVMGLAIRFLFARGIEGVALAVTLAAVARYLFLAQLAVRLAQVSWRQFFSAQIPGCLLGLSASASVYAASIVMDVLGISDFFQMFLIVAVATLSLFLSFLLFPASWFGGLYLWIAERFGAIIPYWLCSIITNKLSDIHNDGVNCKNAKMKERVL